MAGTRRRAVLGGALAGGLGLWLPVLAMAGESGSSPQATYDGDLTTITVHAVEDTSSMDATGSPQPGDRFDATETLTQDGVTVGTSKVACVNDHDDSYQCEVTYYFADGSITAEGPATFSDESTPLGLTITSGTGDYAGATGKLGVVFNRDDSTEDTLSFFRADTSDEASARAEADLAGMQVEVIPLGGADTGGGGTAHTTDSPLLIGIGVAAFAGAAGLFATAHYAARRA